MGKKSGKIALDSVEREEQELDDELQDELEAVLQMRREKAAYMNPTDAPIEKPRDKYNKDGLLQSLEVVGTEALPFLQTLVIADFDLEVHDHNDDLQRELAFYNHAILAANAGRKLLESANIPTRRPVDYFCEQVKSDAHMAKIKDSLLLETKKIEAFEQRKQRDLNRKFNKQVSILRKEEKNKQVKDEISAVSKMRKKRSFSEVSDGPKRGQEDAMNTSGSGRSPGRDTDRQKSVKRVRMDRKYGFGGKKDKRNDKKSTSDMSQFNPKKGKTVHKKGGGKGGSRPGKDARMKKRSQSKAG